MRREALSHAVLRAGSPLGFPGIPEYSHEVSVRFAALMEMLRHAFGDRTDARPDEIGGELALMDPLPFQGSTMDRAAMELERAIQAWRGPG